MQVVLLVMSKNTEFSPDISRVPYVPDGGARDVLCFKYYTASEIVLGGTMEDWLRFSVSYWHSFCGTDMLGSVDANTGSPDLSWDTDQFPMDIRNTTLMMKAIIEQGGLQPGGLNFDAKVRRESTELENLFISHIGATDAFTRGLRNAAKMIDEGVMQNMLRNRYMSFSHGIGLKMEECRCSLEYLKEFIKQNGEPKVTSGKQEQFEEVFNHYL